MTIVNSYLNFSGNTEEAFNFYKSVFGTEFSALVRFKDGPGGDKMSPENADKIMHIALPVGNGNLLMATDMIESMGQILKTGNNFSLSITPGSEEEALKFFNGLSEGGTIEAPFKKEFWGAYFGMFLDKFGVRWMINYDPNAK
ncbi:VOC family protein [Mucilaginibacter ginsenosidivorans]|uniref:VOC family protein n=1 Tax=Mucilaginibacter ginsenosidivorans TaxID=398053 RepID=A0A5B8V099_9SPHI|nr:VOC family protein [Mucilaginibacter ginsenosidivorans]QEC64927.1 VOC family protein [Mucilaginibacter ginsenosidivorans]